MNIFLTKHAILILVYSHWLPVVLDLPMIEPLTVLLLPLFTVLLLLSNAKETENHMVVLNSKLRIIFGSLTGCHTFLTKNTFANMHAMYMQLYITLQGYIFTSCSDAGFNFHNQNHDYNNI